LYWLLTIEWSTTEDTTKYTAANQLTSTDAENIKGFAGVDLKTRINAAYAPVDYICYTSRLEIGAKHYFIQIESTNYLFYFNLNQLFILFYLKINKIYEYFILI
jgi:hypothetical protein